MRCRQPGRLQSIDLTILGLRERLDDPVLPLQCHKQLIGFPLQRIKPHPLFLRALFGNLVRKIHTRRPTSNICVLSSDLFPQTLGGLQFGGVERSASNVSKRSIGILVTQQLLTNG